MGIGKSATSLRFKSRHDSEQEDQSTSMREAKGNIEVKVSKGAIMSPGGPTPYSMAMTASWVSLESFIAWAQSPDGDKYKDLLLENGTIFVFYEVEG